MLAFPASSALPLNEALKKLGKKPVLLLDASKIQSEEELLLADRLARKAIKGKRAISRSPTVEFLLWLSGKTDIKSAFSSFGAKSPKKMLIVSFGSTKKELTSLLQLKLGKKKLKKGATTERIEEISLSRT